MNECGILATTVCLVVCGFGLWIAFELNSLIPPSLVLDASLMRQYSRISRSFADPDELIRLS